MGLAGFMDAYRRDMEAKEATLEAVPEPVEAVEHEPAPEATTEAEDAPKRRGRPAKTEE